MIDFSAARLHHAMMEQTVHGTCVDINGVGVLIRGKSGAGKSDLALRLLDQGARLVADDRVILHGQESALVATCPENLAGLLEIRGIGIVHVEAVTPQSPLGLVIDLTDSAAIARFPEPETTMILDRAVSRAMIAPFEASAPSKVFWAVKVALNPDMRIS